MIDWIDSRASEQALLQQNTRDRYIWTIRNGDRMQEVKYVIHHTLSHIVEKDGKKSTRKTPDNQWINWKSESK